MGARVVGLAYIPSLALGAGCLHLASQFEASKSFS